MLTNNTEGQATGKTRPLEVTPPHMASPNPLVTASFGRENLRAQSTNHPSKQEPALDQRRPPGIFEGLTLAHCVRHPFKSFGQFYLRSLAQDKRVDNLIAGGGSLVVSTVAAVLLKPHIPGKLALAVATGIISTAAFYAAAVPQWLAFRDNSHIRDECGTFKSEGLYACFARYASMFIINEPAYFTIRVGVLSGFLFSAPVLPVYVSNPIAAVMGIVSAYVWLPWLQKKTEHFQPKLEKMFLGLFGR